MTQTATTTESTETAVAPSSPRPTTSRRRRRLVTTAVLAVFVVVLSAGCSVQDMRAWWDTKGVDHSGMTDAEVQPIADVATTFWANWAAEQQRQAQARYLEALDLARFDHVLNDDQLWRLRQCESGGNYAAVSAGGAYRGAYQFARSSWDGVARQHFPAYVGLDPAAARPEVQDAMTRALWSMSGPRPWPVCGYRV